MRFLRQSETGASLLEFAIVFPLFAVLVLAIIDFGRASTLRAVVDEAVSQTLTVALSVPNLDVNQIGPPQLAADEVRYQRMQAARILSEDRGLGFLRSVGQLNVEPDNQQTGTTAARLHDLVYTDNLVANGPAEVRTKLMVLRPGECAEVPTLGVTECNRQTLGLSAADPTPSRPPEALMERHPIKVVAYATFDSYLPFFFDAPIRIEGFGYRQPIPEAPFSEPINQRFGINDPLAVSAPTPLQPLGRPVMPEADAEGCDTPEWWGQAIQRSRDQGKPYAPRLVGGICKPCPIDGACL